MSMQADLSRFMNRTLLPDEELVLEGRFHPFYTFTCYFSLLIWILLGAAAQVMAWRYAYYVT